MVPILWCQFLGNPVNSSDLRWFKDYIMLICGDLQWSAVFLEWYAVV